MTIPLSKGKAVNGYLCSDMPWCTACVPNNNREQYPIHYDQASDVPVHCFKCFALIFTTLTTDGANYVRKALATNYGEADTLDVWRRAWPALAGEAAQ